MSGSCRRNAGLSCSSTSTCPSMDSTAMKSAPRAPPKPPVAMLCAEKCLPSKPSLWEYSRFSLKDVMASSLPPLACTS